MHHFLQIRGTKPKLLVGMICVAVFLITCISILSFASVKRLLTNVTNKNMAVILENSSRGRNLAKLFADINIMRHTFYGKNDYIKSEGTRLRNTLEDIIKSTIDTNLKKNLMELLDSLNSFLAHCNVVNSVLHARNNIHDTIHDMLENLEKLIGHSFVKQTLNGKDTTFVEQLLMLIVGYQESLLEIDKLYEELEPGHFFEHIEAETSLLIISIDDLTLRLQTITASVPDVAKNSEQIIHEMQKYRQITFRHYKELEKLGFHMKALDNSKSKLLSEMGIFDEKTSKTIQTLNTKIVTTIFISSTIALTLTIIIVVSLGFLINNLGFP